MLWIRYFWYHVFFWKVISCEWVQFCVRNSRWRPHGMKGKVVGPSKDLRRSRAADAAAPVRCRRSTKAAGLRQQGKLDIVSPVFIPPRHPCTARLHIAIRTFVPKRVGAPGWVQVKETADQRGLAASPLRCVVVNVVREHNVRALCAIGPDFGSIGDGFHRRFALPA